LRRREAAAIVVVLLALAATAWLSTDLRMAGMDAGPWTDPGPFGFYISAWVVMMAAMMLPSIVPMGLMFSRLEHARSTPAVGGRASASARPGDRRRRIPRPVPGRRIRWICSTTKLVNGSVHQICPAWNGVREHPAAAAAAGRNRQHHTSRRSSPERRRRRK